MSAKRHDPSPLKVLFATPECAPLVKTGGLGDVSASLPPALRAIGIDARVLLPGYPAVREAARGAPELARWEVLGQEVRVLEAALPTGVPLLVLDCPALYDRGGGPYQDDEPRDWDDNALRFGVLSKAAAMLTMRSAPLDWHPDVVHCNDWPTALAPVYMHQARRAHGASLVTIHNLAFQGLFERPQVEGLELTRTSLGADGMAFHGRVSFLRGGLVYADAINAVSPTYAREIQGEALGFGMQDVLRARADRLYGVLNGIDTTLWNPATDPHLAANYDAASLDEKAKNTAALRERLALADRSDRPLLAMVTRLTHQKGIDIVLEAAERLLAMPAQLVFVGTGDRELEARLAALRKKHPEEVGVYTGFDEPLAHLVEAGCDIFLMPSRFEPCGMNQMFSQRYGSPPVANATGGLIDTVADDETGFLMSEATPAALIAAAARAVKAWHDRPRWRVMQKKGMARDFGWGNAAEKYRAIYEAVVAK